MNETYNFGQFRKTQVSKYVNELNYNDIENVITEAPFDKAITFVDKMLNLKGTGNLLESTDSTKTKSRSYFLRYKIYKKIDREQIIDIILVKSNEIVDKTQEITTIKIPTGNPTDSIIFDLVITPNSKYDQIQFILNRDSKDYQIETSPGIYGRQIDIEILNFDEIINIIDAYLNPVIKNRGTLKQIGVQSAPGTLMCIDGEEIRVGRSGIYEIKNGININFLGFVIHEDEEKFFILDYQY